MNLKSLHRVIENGALTVEQKFLKQLELTIQAGEQVTKRVRSTNYKPSALNCPRQMFYYRKGIAVDPEPTPPSLVGVAQSGTDRHKRIQDAVMAMAKQGYDCRYIDVADFVRKFKPKGTKVVGKYGAETKCYNDIYKMSFMCDGILKIGNKYYVLEIKTESTFKFTARFGVDEKHYAQATCYSLLFGLDDVIFLYENRDTCTKKTFLFKVTEKMRQDIVDKIGFVEKCLAENELPQGKREEKVCMYCDYKNRCRLNLRD